MIKGTTLYDPSKGGFGDLGVLDVQQIFGRAGRPGFDTSGEASSSPSTKNLRITALNALDADRVAVYFVSGG